MRSSHPVVVTLQGGLGNQLYQYFAGLWVTRQFGGDSKLYQQFWNPSEQTFRTYRLHEFQVEQRFSTLLQRCEMRLSTSLKARPLWSRLGVLFPDTQFTVVHDEGATLRSALQAPGGVWLQGHWQRPDYLEEIRPQIVEQLRLRQPLSPEAQAWQQRMESTPDAVCVHIRRGDYITRPASVIIHGILPKDYFVQAMSRLREMRPSAHFFLFSDDPDWTAAELVEPGLATLVQYETDENRRDVEDFTLMRACRHFIISNSTYSWWPAWLGPDLEKIVIAPKRWYANGQPTELIPPGWITM